jgi:hypothetical protein
MAAGAEVSGALHDGAAPAAVPGQVVSETTLLGCND